MKYSTSYGLKELFAARWVWLVTGAFILLIFSIPGHASDLFADAKTNIEETAGDGSSVHLSLMAAGLISAMLVGYVSKNWIAGIATFVIGVIFWSVASSIVFS